jgi:hypothetical protein
MEMVAWSHTSPYEALLRISKSGKWDVKSLQMKTSRRDSHDWRMSLGQVSLTHAEIISRIWVIPGEIQVEEWQGVDQIWVEKLGN